MRCRVLLESAAEAVCKSSAKYPRIYQLPPREGREVLEKAQDVPVFMYPAQIHCIVVDTGIWGKIPTYIVKPEKTREPVDVIFYTHGAEWVFGSFHTHEKLVRELAARTGCIVVFPEYSRSPEVRYPVAIEQCYYILCRIAELLCQIKCGMNTDTLTIAGDSAGGNLAIALALVAKYRKGVKIHKQLLYYPVTNACFHTESYCEFANGYYLYQDEMQWFWDQYTCSITDRNQITASPLRASQKQLCGLPDTMILNGEADVLRDEGETFAEKLRRADVSITAIRFQAIIHDFVMLNSLDQTNACRAAMDVSTAWIQRKNDECYIKY